MALPTCIETRDRIASFIATLDNEDHRTMVQVWSDHWWGEVVGDIDAIMATMPDDPAYQVYGPIDKGPMMQIEGKPGSAAIARIMYEQMLAADQLPGPPFENEKFVFTPFGMIVDSHSLSVAPGAALAGLVGDPSYAEDPDQLYLVRGPVSMIVPFDFERKLMLGELVYTGVPFSIEPVDHSIIRELLGFDRTSV